MNTNASRKSPDVPVTVTVTLLVRHQLVCESSQKDVDKNVKNCDALPRPMRPPIVSWESIDVATRRRPIALPQRMCTPEMAREMMRRWISLVPSKIV